MNINGASINNDSFDGWNEELEVPYNLANKEYGKN